MSAGAGVAGGGGGEFEIFLEGAVWGELEFFEVGVVGLYRFGGGDFGVGDGVEVGDEGELVLAVVDFPAEEGGACAVFFGVFEEFEGVVGGAAGAAEDSGDEGGVIGDEFFHGAGAVVGDLEKDGTAGGGDAGECADDQVVDEAAEIGGAMVAAGVGVEDFEEMAKTLGFGFDAEFLVGQQSGVIEFELVVGGDGVEAEVRAGRRSSGVGLTLPDWSCSMVAVVVRARSSLRGRYGVSFNLSRSAW